MPPSHGSEDVRTGPSTTPSTSLPSAALGTGRAGLRTGSAGGEVDGGVDFLYNKGGTLPTAAPVGASASTYVNGIAAELLWTKVYTENYCILRGVLFGKKGVISVNSRKVLTFVPTAFGIVLLASLVLVLNVLFKPAIGQASPATGNPSREYLTAGWKVYTDTVYGYSIEYPPNWYLYPTSPDAAGKGGVAQIASYDQDALLGSKHSEVIPPDSLKVEIGIFDARKSVGQTLQEWLEARPVKPEKTEVKGLDALMVDETPSIKLTFERECFSNTTIFVPREDIVYFISVVPALANSMYADTFELMLQSFHFHKEQLFLSAPTPELPSVQEMSASVNFILPFDGQATITNGPGEGLHGPGEYWRSAEAIDLWFLIY